MNQSVRGSSTDFEAIWTLPIATRIGGKLVESFCLDASGLLVYRSGEKGNPKALIPFAYQAWAVDSVLLGRFIKDLRTKLESPFAPENQKDLYANGLSRFPGLYAGTGTLYAETSLLQAAIEAYDEADEGVKEEIKLELCNFGLFPFHSIDHLGTDYYEVIGQSLVKGKVSQAGWVNQDSVFRKVKIV